MPSPWNIELIREILLCFIRTVDGSSSIRTDGLLSGSLAIPGRDEEAVSTHFYHLAEIGCLTPHRITMRPPPDYVVWGLSDRAKLWARCAVEDRLWESVVEEVQQTLNADLPSEVGNSFNRSGRAG